MHRAVRCAVHRVAQLPSSGFRSDTGLHDTTVDADGHFTRRLNRRSDDGSSFCYSFLMGNRST